MDEPPIRYRERAPAGTYKTVLATLQEPKGSIKVSELTAPKRGGTGWLRPSMRLLALPALSFMMPLPHLRNRLWLEIQIPFYPESEGFIPMLQLV